jgi:lipopolysaccharide transport protein LptA
MRRVVDLIDWVMRLFLLSSTLFLAAATPKEMPLDIEAGHLEVRQDRGEARFSKGVVVRQAHFTLRCTTMVARYDKKGRVDTLEADGAVRVEMKGWSAVAAKARYERTADTLSLTGDPILHRN